MASQRTPLKSAIMNVMSKAVFKAARGLVRDFGEVERLQVSEKSLGNFVSSTDLRIEKILREELHQARPDFGMIAEESGEVIPMGQSASRWIIDPLDGTKNFIHGIPHFAISVALEEKGEITAGITYDPIKDEMFAAQKGYGAFMNDKRLRVSSRKTLSEFLIATGPSFLHKEAQVELLQKAIRCSVVGFRRMGASSLDLAYVAAGRLEAFLETNPPVWDSAVGSLLITEAGGSVTDMSGRSRGTEGPLLASNGRSHKELLQLFG